MAIEEMFDVCSNRDIIRKKLVVNPEDIVYVSGSILEGFGNKSSDVDVFVIMDKQKMENAIMDNKEKEELSLITDHSIIYNFIHDGLRFDVEYWDRDYVLEIISKLEQVDLNTDYYRNRLNSAEIDFIHRLKFGKPVNSEVEFVALLKSVDLEKLNFVQFTEYSEYFSSYLEDIRGALESKDFLTVYILSHIILDVTINLYLSSKGETNPSSKWILRKLQRYISGENSEHYLMDNYLKFKSYTFNEETIEKHVLNLLNFTQRLNDNAQLNIKQKQLR